MSTRRARERETVLVVLHYQNDILHRDGKVRLGVADDSQRARLINSAQRLLDGGRKAGLGIVHVRTARVRDDPGYGVNPPIFRNVVAQGACIEGEWGSEFFEPLSPAFGETVVTHNRVNGFFESNLEAELRRLGAEKIILGGVATNSCVEHTARHAADMDYQVVVAADACSAARQEVHDAALFNISLVGWIGTVDQLVADDFR